MTMRLEKLGLIGEPKPRPRLYFRKNGALNGYCPLSEQLVCGAA
jgi:hypothetical protein